MTRVLIALILVLAAGLTVYAGQQIVIPVTFVHQGRSVQALMAVDTGASVTTTDTALADQLGVPKNTRHGGMAQMADGRAVSYRTAIMDVSADTLTRRGIDVNIMDYSGARGVSGMLGLNFLSGLTMTIDWQNKRISWSNE